MKKLTLSILMVLLITCGCGVNKDLPQETSAITNNQNDETLSQQYQLNPNQEKSLNKEDPQAKEQTEESLEKLHPIDKAERDCIAKNMTTTGMSECSYKAMDAWFREIDKYIGLLKNVTSEEDYNNILNAQTKWKEYQEAEFKAVSIISEKQGTMFQNIAVGVKTEIVKKRAQEIEDLYNTLIE